MRRLRLFLALVVAAGTGYAMRGRPQASENAPQPAAGDPRELQRRSYDLGFVEGRARTIADAVGTVDRARGQLDKDREAAWSTGYAAGADEALAELYPESHAARASIERMLVERRRPRLPGY